MPRPLKEFSARDLLHGRPLLFYKRILARRIETARFVRQPDRDGRSAQVAASIRDRNALCTVAFNYPDTIAVQQALLQKYVSGCERLILDNSSDASAAGEIRRIADRFEVRYLRLPPNPTNNPNHSHACALNWTWRNVIRPGRPAACGFIDHDLYPTEPCDPFALLGASSIAGSIRSAWGGSPRWNLWAGFCFFRFDVMDIGDLDFDYDFDAGLDTGGANWWRIYRHVDRARVPDVPMVTEPLRFEGRPAGHVHRLGAWVHKANHGYSHGPDRLVKDRWMASLVPSSRDVVAPAPGPADAAGDRIGGSSEPIGSGPGPDRA